jgi:hypothetical protein
MIFGLVDEIDKPLDDANTVVQETAGMRQGGD